MGEQTGETNATEETSKPEQQNSFVPISSQEDFDKAIQSRIARERAKFADYDVLKDRAAKLDQIEDANKSEIERAKDAQLKAENELADLKLETTRLRVASKHGIGAEHIDLLTGVDEAELKEKAEKLAALIEKDESKPRFPKPDPSQGGSGKSAELSNAERFASFMEEL